MTDEKYEIIKEKILNLFNDVKSFKWDANDFYDRHSLKHPYFNELKQRLSHDGNPFYVEAIDGVSNADGDPVKDIRFYKK